MMPLIAYVMTDGMSSRLLARGQFSYLRERGFELVIIANPGIDLKDVERRERVKTLGIPMCREVHLWKDVLSLVKLYLAFRRFRPEIVNAGTPKAGALGMLAAFLARVPIRIYILRGLRLETIRGIKRRVLLSIERITSFCATRVLCVSQSLLELHSSLGLVRHGKSAVLLQGSSNGVDIHRYRRAPARIRAGKAMRRRLGIPDDAPVVGFVGRFTKDKGLPELSEAFDMVLTEFPDARLLMVGEFEEGDPLSEKDRERLRSNPNIVLTGFVWNTAVFYHLMDVLAFTSHREGFPNVPLEAQACQVPVVGFRATGTVDAVESGVTGVLVRQGDVARFSENIRMYLREPELRKQHGAAGRRRVALNFRNEMIWEALYREYVRLLDEKGLPSDCDAPSDI